MDGDKTDRLVSFDLGIGRGQFAARLSYMSRTDRVNRVVFCTFMSIPTRYWFGFILSYGGRLP